MPSQWGRCILARSSRNYPLSKATQNIPSNYNWNVLKPSTRTLCRWSIYIRYVRHKSAQISGAMHCFHHLAHGLKAYLTTQQLAKANSSNPWPVFDQIFNANNTTTVSEFYSHFDEANPRFFDEQGWCLKKGGLTCSMYIYIHIYIHIHIHIHIHIYIYTVYSVYIYTLFLQPCFRTYVPVTETIECQRDASPVSSVQLRTMRAGPHEWSVPYTAYPSCCKGAVT